MTRIANLHQHIENQNWDALEEEWLAAIEAKPIDVAGLIALLELLGDSGESKRASFLYELLADQLTARSQWEELLDLQHHYRAIFGEHLTHREVLDTLTALYEDSELFHTLADKVGLHRATDNMPKIWTKVDKLHGLMDLAPGTIVEMKGQGAGRVDEVNIQLGSFKVDLGKTRPVSVGFAAAPKMLRPLPVHHVLYRRVADPASLEKLAAEHPDELIQVTLESYDDPMTANEIKTALSGIVSDRKWTSFWNKARKNSRLMALPGARQRYQWAASADDAVTVLEERFSSAPLPEQLDLFKAHAERDPELRETMVSHLRDEAASLVDSDPASAYQIGVALDRAGHQESQAAWSPGELLAAADDPSRFIENLADRSLREDAYQRLSAVRDDWIETFGQAMRRESEARTLEFLSQQLTAADATETLDRALGDLLNQPQRSPGGFTWLAERAAEEEALLTRSPLRLFQRILDALGDSAFQSQRKRLLALLDSGGTIPRLVHRFDLDQARRAEDVLSRAAGLEDYQKTPLSNAIQLRFPELRKSDIEPLYTLETSLESKRAELKELLEVEIPANRKAIEEARELGDLRENFEYKSARQRHEYLSSIATLLNRDLSRARVINFDTVDPSTVRLGTRVTLGNDSGKELGYAILGPWESDPDSGVLSNESELAARLLGLAPGDEIEIDDGPFVVRSIEVYSA